LVVDVVDESFVIGLDAILCFCEECFKLNDAIPEKLVLFDGFAECVSHLSILAFEETRIRGGLVVDLLPFGGLEGLGVVDAGVGGVLDVVDAGGVVKVHLAWLHRS
jgi:hypothetical protein